MSSLRSAALAFLRDSCLRISSAFRSACFAILSASSAAFAAAASSLAAAAAPTDAQGTGHIRFVPPQHDEGEADEELEVPEHALRLGMAKVNWLSGSKELLYLSEKDGHRHIYLVDIASGLMKAVTAGEFVVRYIDKVDEEARQIWFRASGRHEEQDPYLIHYYRVNFDGSGFTALTDGNGTHEISYSPDRQFLIDTYSRVDQAPIHELRNVSNGKLVCKLEETDVSELLATG